MTYIIKYCRVYWTGRGMSIYQRNALAFSALAEAEAHLSPIRRSWGSARIVRLLPRKPKAPEESLGQVAYESFFAGQHARWPAQEAAYIAKWQGVADAIVAEYERRRGAR